MVKVTEIIFMENFEREIKKIKSSIIKERVRKQIDRVINSPEIGKPLRFDLKGERTIHIKPYRLIYSFNDNKIYFLRFEHRETVY